MFVALQGSAPDGWDGDDFTCLEDVTPIAVCSTEVAARVAIAELAEICQRKIDLDYGLDACEDGSQVYLTNEDEEIHFVFWYVEVKYVRI